MVPVLFIKAWLISLKTKFNGEIVLVAYMSMYQLSPLLDIVMHMVFELSVSTTVESTSGLCKNILVFV